MNGDKIRIAAIGLGWVSCNRHLPVIARSPDYALAGVIDPKAEVVRSVAGRYGTRSAVARQLSEVPWLDEVDALVIGTPPFVHAALIEEALERGKHVLTEKPFVMQLADGERLAELALRRSRVLAIVHNFQFARSFLCLQRDMKSGRLGAVRAVWAFQLSNPARRLPAWYEELPGGLFFDESPHLLYLLRRLLPDLQLRHVQLTPSRRGGSTPAEVQASLSNAGGQTATVLMNFEAALSEWHVVVIGEHGTADVDIFRDIYLFLPNDGRHGARDILRTGLGATAAHLWGTLTSGLLHLASRLDYGNREVFFRFVQAVRGPVLQPQYIGSREALAVRRMQQQILEAGS